MGRLEITFCKPTLAAERSGARVLLMARRSGKSDTNTRAFDILRLVTASEEPAEAEAAGRRGGLKGGQARAKALSAQQRREIARIAANARWKKSGS